VVQLLPDFTVSKIWLRYNEDIEDYQYCLAVKNAGAGVDYVTEHEGFLSYANLNLRIMSLDKNADDSEDWLEVEGENEKLIFQSGAIREYCFGNTDNVAQQKSVALTATVWYYKPAGPYEQNIDNNSLTKTIAVPAKPVPGTAQ